MLIIIKSLKSLVIKSHYNKEDIAVVMRYARLSREVIENQTRYNEIFENTFNPFRGDNSLASNGF